MYKFPSENIRAIRESVGLSQEFVASELGISQSAYGKVESGHTKITLDRLYMLSKIFGVNLEVIINYDKTKVLQTNTDATIAQEPTLAYYPQLKIMEDLIDYQRKEIVRLQSLVDQLQSQSK